MGRLLADYGLFFKEFRRTFHTTGAILPSSPRLGRALARFVPPQPSIQRGNGSPARPRRILEVGPGTGAVTSQIVQRLAPQDQLDLVELNDRFVARLKDRFASEPRLAAVAPRTTIHHTLVQDLPVENPYDVVISGLPLNNFSVELAESILGALKRLVAPGGTLSYFEYIAVRPMRLMVAGGDERRRIRGLNVLFGDWLERHEFSRQAVVTNVPPAWVHHLRFDG